MAECVQVAVSNATFHFDKLYSYSVPAHLQDRVFVGSMVLVPFGRACRMSCCVWSIISRNTRSAPITRRSRPSFPTERSTKL